jgi:biopolymer transport protein ExbD
MIMKCSIIILLAIFLTTQPAESCEEIDLPQDVNDQHKEDQEDRQVVVQSAFDIYYDMLDEAARDHLRVGLCLDQSLSEELWRINPQK